MLKTFLFIILVMLMKPALAASIMSHEKFVHLTYEEQRKIVITTMELIVEMESKYKHEVKTSGFDSERFRRYTEFMKKVSSLMFPEAHAASVKNQRYGQYLNQLTTILNPKGRNRCIYGGWVSEMRGDKCTHPLNTKQFKTIYQTESGCTGNGNQITCNPAVFGFKNVGQKSLFCVPAGESGADNTSRDCMVKALADSPETGASTREARIANMIEGISRNPNDANAMFDFLLKACACDASKSPQISEHYSNYMRPHQTCYAILKMMSEVTPQCQVNNQPLMDGNQTQFLSAIRGILSETEMKSGDVKTLYTNKLTELRASNPEFKSSEAAVCGGAPVDPNPVGDIQCVNRKTVPGGQFCCEEGLIPNEAKNDCIARPDTDGDGAIITDTQGGSASGAQGGAASGAQGGAASGAQGGAASGAQGGAASGAQGGAASGTQGGDTPVTCTAPNEELDAEKKTCKCKFGDRPEGEDAQCPDESTTNTTGITVSLSSTNKDTNTTKITATLLPAGTEKSSYTIFWFSRGSKRPTKFPGSTPRNNPENITGSLTNDPAEATTTEGSTSNADPRPDDTTRTPGENETDLNRDGVWDIEAPREAEDYELCARLIKDNKKVHEDCEKVPKKPIIAPRRNGNGMGGNPFGPQQMGPTRGGPSDAIFRGIR